MVQHSMSLATFELSSTSEAEEESLMNKTGNPLCGLFENKRNVFKADELGLEIATIALPALLALASDPLASLVDAAFIGHIGPVELGAVGVSISVFNMISKVFNLPLFNITTSLVTEDASIKEIFPDLPLEPNSLVLDGLLSSEALDENGKHCETPELKQPKEKPCLPSVSSALVLGATLGLGEALVLLFLVGPILTVMGVDELSPMRLPTAQYLMWRALGAPAVVVSLAI